MRILRAFGRAVAAPFADVDRWDVFSVAGAGLLGGGVWREWGPAWACMLWGALLLSLAGLHAARAGREE
jgi:hypothetical protein